MQQFITPDGKSTIDAILIIPETLGCAVEPFRELALFAGEHKIPIGGAYLAVEGHSSLFNIGINHFKTGKQAAPLANEALKGTPAGTIMVVSSETFLNFNYKLA